MGAQSNDAPQSGFLATWSRARTSAFLVCGVGTEVAAVLGLLFMFRRRGWL